MKKLFSIVLALALIFALSLTVFAADPITPSATEVTKEYKLTGGEYTPTEKLEFTVTLESGVEGGVEGLPVVGTENEVQITSSKTAKTDFNITFPAYKKVGVYTYKITEKKGSTLGVTYDETPIYVVVTITNKLGDDGKAIVDEFESFVAIHKGSVSAEKKDDSEFQNEYGLGQLTVTKQVSGNLASNEKKFTIHVKFEGKGAASAITYKVAGGAEKTLSLESGSATADIELSNSQSAVFMNIPAGVTYTVEEDEKHTKDADKPGNTEEGYTVTYTKSDSEGKIAAGDKDTVEINNKKGTEVNTGVILDYLPYAIGLIVVLAIAVFMIIRKRRYSED